MLWRTETKAQSSAVGDKAPVPLIMGLSKIASWLIRMDVQLTERARDNKSSWWFLWLMLLMAQT